MIKLGNGNKPTKENFFKVGQITPRYHPYIGGVETHVQSISERLARRGHSIEVLSTDPKKNYPTIETQNDVKLLRFKSYAPNDSYYFSLDLAKYLKKNTGNYDIIHTHSYHAFPALYAANNKKESKLVFTPHFHGKGHTFFRNLLHKPYKIIGKKIFNKSDLIIAVSDYEKKLILKSFKLDETKITVIPNGINKQEFNRKKTPNNKINTILTVGRLEKYKGIQYLIQVLPHLEDTFLEVVGDGPYYDNLVEQISRLGLNKRVSLLKNIPRQDLLSKYADADLFILLSQNEAYGITVAEALASGTPCIVANASALTQWVDNKNCYGIDFPIGDEQLISMIKSIKGKKVEKVNVLDWDEVVDKIVISYKELYE